MGLIINRLRPAKRAVWIVLAALGAAALAVQGPTPASAYTALLEIECNENPVSEGDTYRLHIEKPGDMSWQPLSIRNETMKVYWTTESDTAWESDYRPLHHEGQASNHFQSWNGRMGRTFYTTEDDLSELTEWFTVKAENAADGGTVGDEDPADDEEVGECYIEIADDDGPGSYLTRIIAYPDSGTYRRGDVIDFSVHFTHEVIVTGGTPTLGLHVGEGTGDEPNRYATLQPGSGHLTPFQFGYYTLFFRYQVGPDDLDPDGISVPSGEFGGTGKITRRWNDGDLNQKYHGVVERLPTKGAGPNARHERVDGIHSTARRYLPPRGEHRGRSPLQSAGSGERVRVSAIEGWRRTGFPEAGPVPSRVRHRHPGFQVPGKRGRS